MRTYTQAHGLPSNYITALHQDRAGFHWIGTDRGLSRYDGKSFRTYTPGDGLPSPLIYSVFESSEGVLWVGMHDGGAARLVADRFVPVKGGVSVPFRTVGAIGELMDGSI
jgi:ligand-binding sensor domain-containing protein